MTARTALIVGASSGIGLAIAEKLAQAGHDLTLVGRSAEKLASARERIAPSARVVTLSLDVRQDDAASTMVSTHIEAFSRLDVLVICAGVGQAQPIAELTLRKLDLHLALNVRMPAMMCREAAPYLRAAGAEHRKAHVILISSMVAQHGVRNFLSYSASKSAMSSMADVINDEWGAEGVHATAICPALVNTDMAAQVPGIDASTLIAVSDVAEIVRAIVSLSPACLLREVVLSPPGGDPLRDMRT